MSVLLVLTGMRWAGLGPFNAEALKITFGHTSLRPRLTESYRARRPRIGGGFEHVAPFDPCYEQFPKTHNWLECEDAQAKAKGCILDKVRTDQENLREGFDNVRFYICN